jgi:hypothetical protein
VRRSGEKRRPKTLWRLVARSFCFMAIPIDATKPSEAMVRYPSLSVRWATESANKTAPVRSDRSSCTTRLGGPTERGVEESPPGLTTRAKEEDQRS